MNFATLFKAYDAVMMFRDAARRYRGTMPAPPAADRGLSPTAPGSGLGGQIEARLTNVVVAALKEAFDRDHARLELERAQIAEERRRSEEALRVELRRQAIDREVGRLRLLAGAAVVGWIASIVMFAVRAASTSTEARVMAGGGWLLLLGALAASFTAQSHVGAGTVEERATVTSGGGTASLWLLVAGLAVTALSLLF